MQGRHATGWSRCNSLLASLQATQVPLPNSPTMPGSSASLLIIHLPSSKLPLNATTAPPQKNKMQPPTPDLAGPLQHILWNYTPKPKNPGNLAPSTPLKSSCIPTTPSAPGPLPSVGSRVHPLRFTRKSLNSAQPLHLPAAALLPFAGEVNP
jgi:hypothetical protein